jgi:hypothetical protein
MILKAIKFKKQVDSEWMAGICFEANGTADDIIIDSDDQVVELPVYDIKDCLYDLCVNLTPILESINNKKLFGKY